MKSRDAFLLQKQNFADAAPCQLVGGGRAGKAGANNYEIE
jgi:hypothetical protein